MSTYRCAQIKVDGLREHLEPVKQRLSDAIQADRKPNEVEVTIAETPQHNWGFGEVRGTKSASSTRWTSR